MIPFASQRGGGQDLATHLLNAYDNEIAEVAHLRGTIADDLHGAFKEWEVQADALTRCEKYLYSLSINPDPAQGPLTRDQYMDYIARAEEMLGLKEQPRAVVFHIKEGREHCHVVWSRIDADQQRAVHLAFDRDKLMRVTRSFARDHHLDLPEGYEKSRQVGQVSLYEQVQKQQTGLSKADHMRQVTEAWQHSDDARSFVQALAERGYVLATGKRPYLVVDFYGNVNALPKLIDDKSVRTADIRAFLERDYPAGSLPSVEEAEKLVAEHRKLIERSLREDQYADGLAALKHSQQERRVAIERERSLLAERQQQQRLTQQHEQRARRDTLRANYLKTVNEIRLARYINRPTGLVAFLGRVSGIEYIRKILHRRDDAKRLSAYGEALQTLKTQQAIEAKALDTRLKLQTQEVSRKQAALEKIDKRELAAFMRDQRTVQRVRSRDGGDAMPSLAELVDHSRTVETPIPDLLTSFERAKQQQPEEMPDLMSAFKRAAKPDSEREGDSGTVGLDRARPPELPSPDGPERGR